MKNIFRKLLPVFFIFISSSSYSQINSLAVSPEKEKKFSIYMLAKHKGFDGLEDFKKYYKYDYLKELWYFSESFYIKNDYFKEGVKIEDSMIDISRFEKLRKWDEESIVILPGFKDVLVLLPVNKLIYLPKN